MHSGSCACGKVQFTIQGELQVPDACHCSVCRKISGHYWASSDVARSALQITGEENLTWFASSTKVERGFCKTCGSTLFWAPVGRDWLGVSMGALDTPTGTTLGMHIFVDDKGDYYDITDGLPQNAQ